MATVMPNFLGEDPFSNSIEAPSVSSVPKAIPQVVPPSKPSKPSVKLTAFDEPTITIVTKTI